MDAVTMGAMGASVGLGVSVCRIVLFRSDNPGLMGVAGDDGAPREVPAMVTRVLADGRVNLQVFRDRAEVIPVANVPFDNPDLHQPMSWRWPLHAGTPAGRSRLHANLDRMDEQLGKLRSAVPGTAAFMGVDLAASETAIDRIAAGDPLTESERDAAAAMLAGGASAPAENAPAGEDAEARAGTDTTLTATETRLASLDAAEEAGRQRARDGIGIDDLDHPIPEVAKLDDGHGIAFMRGFDTTRAAMVEAKHAAHAQAEAGGQFDGTDGSAS